MLFVYKQVITTRCLLRVPQQKARIRPASKDVKKKEKRKPHLSETFQGDKRKSINCFQNIIKFQY